MKRQKNANRANRESLRCQRQKEVRWKRREQKENAIKKTNQRQTIYIKQTRRPQKNRGMERRNHARTSDVEASTVIPETSFFLFLLLLGDS